MKNGKPNISVIIPTFNGAKKLPDCLNALLSQKTDRDFEIIVVDDGSIDNTAEIVKGFKTVHLISQTNSGPAAARNHGVEKAAGDIILFIDDDCIPELNWLECMIAPFENPEIVGTKGAYLNRQSELIARFVQIEYEEKYNELKKYRYIDFIDTYSAAFRRCIFLKKGGFDISFTTASVEDQEFSFRLAASGHKMVFIPEAMVWHTHVTTISGYIRKKIKIGYWKVFLLMKNPNKATGDSHTPLTLKIQILLTAIFLIFSFFVSMNILELMHLSVLASIFFITTLPLIFRAFNKDPIIGLTAFLFIVCRAMALTTGLTSGFLYMVANKIKYFL